MKPPTWLPPDFWNSSDCGATACILPQWKHQTDTYRSIVMIIAMKLLLQSSLDLQIPKYLPLFSSHLQVLNTLNLSKSAPNPSVSHHIKLDFYTPPSSYKKISHPARPKTSFAIRLQHCTWHLTSLHATRTTCASLCLWSFLPSYWPLPPLEMPPE